MAMVSADGSSQSCGGLIAQIGWFGLRVGGHPALSLHASNEPSELSQWLCHDDSTINIVVVIIIIITSKSLSQQWSLYLQIPWQIMWLSSAVSAANHSTCMCHWWVIHNFLKLYGNGQNVIFSTGGWLQPLWTWSNHLFLGCQGQNDWLGREASQDMYPNVVRHMLILYYAVA